MQSTWIRAHESVTNTVTTSPAAISAAAHAATTPASGLSHRRGAQVGVDTCPVTAAGEWTRAQEVPR